MTDAYEGLDDFEWDLEKASINASKHRVTFEEAMSAFDDPFSLVVPDPDHSEWEECLILIGLSDHQRLLVVIYTEREDSLRLISARAANPAEKRKYRRSLTMDSNQEAPEPKETEMRDHYDFTGGQRGRYAGASPKMAHAVVLAPDVATVFPNAASVNEALRMLVKAARQSVKAEPNGDQEAV